MESGRGSAIISRLRSSAPPLLKSYLHPCFDFVSLFLHCSLSQFPSDRQQVVWWVVQVHLFLQVKVLIVLYTTPFIQRHRGIETLQSLSLFVFTRLRSGMPNSRGRSKVGHIIIGKLQLGVPHILGLSKRGCQQLGVPIFLWHQYFPQNSIFNIEFEFEAISFGQVLFQLNSDHYTNVLALYHTELSQCYMQREAFATVYLLRYSLLIAYLVLALASIQLPLIP